MTDRVCLLRELVTRLGVFAARSEFPAHRTGEGWVVRVLPGHTVVMADDAVRLQPVDHGASDEHAEFTWGAQ